MYQAPAHDRLATARVAPRVGAVAIVVAALIGAGIALTDSAPPSGQLIPIATAPLPPRQVAQPTTTGATSTVSNLPAPTTTLKPGDSGAQVKALQQELKGLGYAIGTVDGSYGAQTSKAVAAFQRANHLTADGVVGPRTLQALAP